MSRVLITTVCSADEFSYYIPMFLYSTKRAYPNYTVKVFVTGTLRDDVRNLLTRMKEEKWVNPDWEVLENQFEEVPKIRPNSNNALRHFVPDEHYAGYDFGYITDVDFLIFKHKPTLKQHFLNIMVESKTCYVSARGPLHRPRRKKVNGKGWIRKYKRVICGRIFFKVPDYLRKTKKQRDGYYRRFIQDKPDSWDNHKPGSYREYDEVMFNRILRESGLPTPKKPNKTLTGRGIGNLYRDIHLGDFKFNKRAHSKRKMTRKIKPEVIQEFLAMEKEKNWKKIEAVCARRGTIRESLRRLRKHIEVR